MKSIFKKDSDGVYLSKLALFLMIAGILYALFLILVAFPLIDKVSK